MKKNNQYVILFFICWILGIQVQAQPTFLSGHDPIPDGKKWVAVDNMSDEFDSTNIDLSKWQIEPMENGWGWIGRAPGLFNADAVSINEGNLCVTVKELDAPTTVNNKEFLYEGGIVRSINPGQHGWYYECKMKANATEMSSTFWIMSQNSDCMKKLELDIQECVGVTTNLTESWANGFDEIFHSNAIHRTTSCVTDATQKQGSVTTSVKNHEQYFVYGCWWKSPTELRFYLDGKYAYSITPSTDFDMPAWLQMAIETYDWNPVPDDGGKVASGTLDERTTKYDWIRTWKLEDQNVEGVNVYPSTINLGAGQARQLTAIIIPENAQNKDVKWSTNNAAVTVDANGKVTGISDGGSAIITATTDDGGFKATCSVTVQTNRVPVLVDTIIITPASSEIFDTDSLLLNYEILPIDADDKTISWSSLNNFASIDTNGLVTALSEGLAKIKISGTNNKSTTCSINIIHKIKGTITFDDIDKYTVTDFEVGKSLPVSCNYVTTTGETVKQGIEYKLVVTDNNEKIYKGYTSYDNDLNGNVSGSSTVTLSTLRATPSDELPSGQFYKIILTLEESDGNKLIAEVYPVNFIAAVGIEDNELEIGIYPNPANSIITIESKENIETINIFNTIGSLVLSTELTDNTVNISNLPEGVYILEVSNKNKRKITKFVIRR